MSQAIEDVTITKFTTELRLKPVQKSLYCEEKLGRNKLKQRKSCKQTKGSVDCREWRKCLWKRRNLQLRWGGCKQMCWKKGTGTEQRTCLGRSRCWRNKEGTLGKEPLVPPFSGRLGYGRELFPDLLSRVQHQPRFSLCFQKQYSDLRGFQPLDSLNINEKFVAR